MVCFFLCFVFVWFYVFGGNASKTHKKQNKKKQKKVEIVVLLDDNNENNTETDMAIIVIGALCGLGLCLIVFTWLFCLKKKSLVQSICLLFFLCVFSRVLFFLCSFCFCWPFGFVYQMLQFLNVLFFFGKQTSHVTLKIQRKKSQGCFFLSILNVLCVKKKTKHKTAHNTNISQNTKQNT